MTYTVGRPPRWMRDPATEAVKGWTSRRSSPVGQRRYLSPPTGSGDVVLLHPQDQVLVAMLHRLTHQQLAPLAIATG